MQTQTRTFYHYQYLAWRDKRVPTATDTTVVLRFIEDVNSQWRAVRHAGPLVIHCRLLTTHCLASTPRGKIELCWVYRTLQHMQLRRGGGQSLHEVASEWKKYALWMLFQQVC